MPQNQSIIYNTSTITRGGAGGGTSDQTQGYGSITSQFIREVGSRIFYVDPSAAPFTLLTDRAGSQVTNNVRFEWYEKTLRAKANQINNAAGYNNTATSLTVDNGFVFQVRDLVLVPRTGEIMLVTAVTSTSITVVRGVAGTTAAALVDNDD
jgi:hypothetical protein